MNLSFARILILVVLLMGSASTSMAQSRLKLRKKLALWAIQRCERLMVATAKADDELFKILKNASPHLTPDRVRQIVGLVPAAKQTIFFQPILMYRKFSPVEVEELSWLPADKAEILELYLDLYTIEELDAGKDPRLQEFLANASIRSSNFFKYLKAASARLFPVAEIRLNRELNPGDWIWAEPLIRSHGFRANSRIIDLAAGTRALDPNTPGLSMDLAAHGNDWPIEDHGRNYLLTVVDDSFRSLVPPWHMLFELLQMLPLSMKTTIYQPWPSTDRLERLLRPGPATLQLTSGTPPPSIDQGLVMLPSFLRLNDQMNAAERGVYNELIDRLERKQSFMAVGLRDSPLVHAFEAYAVKHPGRVTVSFMENLRPFAIVVF